MKMKKFVLFVFVAVISNVCGNTCVNPEVTSKSFTTQDATIVTNIAYVSEFDVKCTAGDVSNLYADIQGNIVPAARVGPKTFQVSWTEEIKTARSGDRVVRIFDEDGYTALRKSIRAGEDISTVPSLFDVIVRHPGAFNGPWLKSEFLAVASSLVIAYLALSARSKLVS